MSAHLSQDDIDRLFREQGASGRDGAGLASSAVAYDFRRPDRIPKEQLRSIHLMHDFFARNVASSLGAYLRAYVTANLVSVEQLSFGEFLQYLPAPTCVSSIGMRPLDGNAVLEVNPSLILPMLDILLGGSGKADQLQDRELTEIEQSIAEGVLRVILHDLHEAWGPVAKIDFQVEATETQPQLMQLLSSNEAIVAIGFELSLGEAHGMMNFGVPSILVKMLGQRFEQQWSIRRRTATERDRDLMRRLVERAPVELDAQLDGSPLPLRDVLALAVGDVISLDEPAGRPAHVRVGGVRKFEAEVVVAGPARGAQILGPSPDRGGD